jgi:uncharacterized membrane protein YidH (DUF202 family)
MFSNRVRYSVTGALERRQPQRIAGGSPETVEMSETAKSPRHGVLERLLARMPAEISASFTDAQREALVSALGESGWRRLPINLRFTISLPLRSFFVTLLAGHERRSRERRSAERRMHPLQTLGNILFVVGVSAVFCLAVLILLLLSTDILEN